MKCPYCGKDVKEDALFCGSCGKELVKIKTATDVAKEANKLEIESESKPNSISLEMPKNIDLEMSKLESELDNQEEDLQSLLSQNTTTGTHTYGNAQAQTVIHQAHKPESDGPILVGASTKTEELIEQKRQEKAERDARIAARNEELERELASKRKPIQQNTEDIVQKDDRLFSMLSYFTPLAWILIYFFRREGSSQFFKRKMNDSLITHILFLLGRLPLVGILFTIAAIFFWVMGVYNLFINKDVKLPVIDDIKIVK